MSRLTPILLALVVAGLGYFALQQSKREAENPVRVERMLYEGLDMRRLRAIRLENIKRSQHFRLERTPAGAWLVVDPMEWPAADEVVRQLVQIVQRSKAERVPEELFDSAVASLERPRGFLETEELMADGSTRLTRVEIGQVDLDGMRVFVRSGGTMMRALRNVESVLDYTLRDLRSKRVFSFAPGEVAEVERIGGWIEGNDSIPLGMRARSFGHVWGIVDPVQAQGDPALFSAWTSYMSSLQADRFASDAPEPDLAQFGLDAPMLTIRLSAAGGGTETLNVSMTDNGLYAKRVALPNVFMLDPATLPFLCEPVEHFYDLTFVRVPRRSVEHVVLERGDGALRFSRGEDEGWTVATGPARPAGEREDGTFSMELPADPDVVADLLNVTETAEIARYYTDLSVDEEFAPDVRTSAIWVKPYGEARRGGRFGRELTNREGVKLKSFHRPGTSLVGAVDPTFAAWAERPLTDFLNRQLWALVNARLRTLSISDGTKGRQYERADEHDWQPKGVSIPARELDPVLDYLVFLRAERHLPEGERPLLEDVIRVQFQDVMGTRSSAEIGRTAEGEVHARVGPLQAVLKHPELLEKLKTVLQQ